MIFCKHIFIPLENIYGDGINLYNARSKWICKKCKKVKYDTYLITESDFIKFERELKIQEILKSKQ